MFELLKPMTNPHQAQAESALAADQLSNGEFWLLASAFASLLTSLVITASGF